MATTYTYPDAYLAKYCLEEREARALADVQLRATAAGYTFSADWLQRLTIVQCYILACLENQANAEDLFTAKLKSYRQQFDVQLPQALAAAAAEAETPGAAGVGIFSIPLERA
jgi:hypothetical protein